MDNLKIIADENIPYVSECFGHLGEIQLLSGRNITAQVLENADVMLIRSITKVDSALLAGSAVKFVATATIGTDHVDLDYLNSHKIGFASAPGSNANSVAEYVIAGILEICEKKHISLQDKSLGIIGVGNVGSRLEKKAKALGLKVILNDPPLARLKNDPKYVPLEKLFDCDFISLHVPLTYDGIDKTFHLADENFFNSLKKGTVIINTSRGAVIDTKVVSKANKVGAIFFDVWENEPNIDISVLKIAQIGTFHIAGYSFDGKINGLIMVYNAVCKHFNLERKFTAESFLPPPKVSEIRLNTKEANHQSLIHEAVKKVYDITADDKNLRQVISEPENCGRIFDKLRKEYPVRREFQNTKIILEPFDKVLAERFIGIGFKVENDR